MYKLGFEEAEEPEIKLPVFVGSRGKQGSSRKTSTSASLTTLKPLCGSQQSVGNSLEMGIPDHLTCLLINLYAPQEAIVRTGRGTMDCFKTGKEYVKAIYCHSAYLTSIKITSCEMLGWMNHKLNQDC